MNDQMYQLLKTINLFQKCSEATLKLFATHAQTINLPKNKILFVNKEPANNFYLITQGWMKLYRENIDGEQSVIDILSKHKIFGKNAIFENNVHSFTAESVEDSKLISLPLTLLKSEIEQNAKFAIEIMASMAQQRKQQDQEIENRTLKNAPQRIGCFLLNLTNRRQSGSTTISLPYDKTLIASKLGMQPETFSRALNKLKSQITMDVKGSDIYIDDIKDLVNYACSSCSSNFPCEK